MTKSPYRFHVWTQAEMLEMLAALRRMRAFDIEVIFILRRDNGDAR